MSTKNDQFVKAVEATVTAMHLRPLKPKQLEALESFMSGKDTFVALPTGYRKSVIFAMLPLMFDNILGKEFYSRDEYRT